LTSGGVSAFELDRKLALAADAWRRCYENLTIGGRFVVETSMPNMVIFADSFIEADKRGIVHTGFRECDCPGEQGCGSRRHLVSMGTNCRHGPTDKRT